MNNEKSNGILEVILKEITPLQQAKTDNKMLLAAKIMDAIKEKGLTKTEFAVMLGIRLNAVDKWLSGTHNFTIDTLSEIETSLGVKLLNLNHDQFTFKK